ncbi:hypothetical protein AN957_05015 [Cytobacillus solani]|uniref:Uncharacterized protein n=1 Tax=Cytobacillus solani TaxID=1637975 RepID=A0A0Q3VFY5_9BACI|nr:hypothetical protein AMS60_23475 [Bacillus sp. FJAT-21945]KQL18034.1 hypothetical protein AN957_05015 [Cytobacillus solani]
MISPCYYRIGSLFRNSDSLEKNLLTYFSTLTSTFFKHSFDSPYSLNSIGIPNLFQNMKLEPSPMLLSNNNEIFVSQAVLIGGLITEDFGEPGELTRTVGSIVLVSILLFILSFITS